MNTGVVLLDDIESVTKRALQTHGASEAIASHVAHAVRLAEANGNLICGLYYLESYCQQLDSGRVDGRVEPVVSHDRGGAVRVDAKFGFAQSAFAAGFDTAVECRRSLLSDRLTSALGRLTGPSLRRTTRRPHDLDRRDASAGSVADLHQRLKDPERSSTCWLASRGLDP